MLIVVAMLALVQNANAMEVTFNFSAYSSGADIYPCNAGIWHGPSSSRCLLLDGATPCGPGQPGCVCTTGNGTADANHDFAHATLTNWDMTGTPLSVSTKANSKLSRLFSALVTDGTDFSHRLTNLTFNLGSESYGAWYYVDICYRGPQIEYWLNGIGLKTTLDAQITFSDLAGISGSEATYLANAHPAIYTIVECDNQGQGAYKTAAYNGVYDTVATDVYLSSDGTTNSGDFFGSASTLNSTPVVTLFQGLVLSTSPAGLTGSVVQNSGVPRFCKVRYSIWENSQAARLWNIHGSTVQTFTQIQAN